MKGVRTKTVATLCSLTALLLLTTPVAAQDALLDEETSDGDEVFTVFSDGGLFVLGERNTGTIPVEGAGTRMMWYPAKGAFRAGEVTGSQWNATNVGYHSVAFGSDTEASGVASTAMGRRTTASGDRSTTMGSHATASGNRSTAMGRRTTASGDGSTAMGSHATASGDGATAMGEITTASGDLSTAMGFYTTASGWKSTAMGSHASTNGHAGSFVYGDGYLPGDDPYAEVEATRSDQFVVRAQHIWLGTDNSVSDPTGQFLTTSTGAYLSTGGTWTDASSRAAKENLRAVDPGAVLAKVAELPVERWNYRAERPEVQHLGPSAEDFHAAFGLGADAKHIAPLDVGGASLLAIQALEERTREQEQELEKQVETVEELRSEKAEQAEKIEELSDRVQRLEALVEQLEAADPIEEEVRP